MESCPSVPGEGVAASGMWTPFSWASNVVSIDPLFWQFQNFTS